MTKEERIIEIILSGDFAYVNLGKTGRIRGLRQEIRFPSRYWNDYVQKADIIKYGKSLTYKI